MYLLPTIDCIEYNKAKTHKSESIKNIPCPYIPISLQNFTK